MPQIPSEFISVSTDFPLLLPLLHFWSYTVLTPMVVEISLKIMQFDRWRIILILFISSQRPSRWQQKQRSSSAFSVDSDRDIWRFGGVEPLYRVYFYTVKQNKLHAALTFVVTLSNRVVFRFMTEQAHEVNWQHNGNDCPSVTIINHDREMQFTVH